MPAAARLATGWAMSTSIVSGHDGTNYQNIIEGGDVFEEMMDNPSWFEAVSRYMTNDFNRVSIQENFLNVREQGGYIGIHSAGTFRPLFFRRAITRARGTSVRSTFSWL
jgi:hypothetical protein